MKSWFTRNVRIRSMLALSDLQNKWIMEGVSCIVNVSSDFNEEIYTLLVQKAIPYFWFPMSETNDNMGLHSIYGALKVLQTYIEQKKSVIIHCFGGNNRSRVVYESLYYLNFKSWPVDVDGTCKVLQNCSEGHLPNIEEYEQFLENISKHKLLNDCLIAIK